MQLCNSSFEKPQIYQKTKLKLTEEARADRHHPKYVGSSYTWVKMEKPNLEALRLALQDGVICSENTNLEPNDLQKKILVSIY